MYQKFSSGYLHRTCCFIGFFFLSLSSHIEVAICIGKPDTFRHDTSINFWIYRSKEQHFIRLQQLKDRRHLHYSVCIPNDQKSNAGECTHETRVMDKEPRERAQKKCGRQKDSLERNWYWKDFFSCARRRSDNESWFRVVAVSVKILHMCATICGFQTDSISFFFLFLFDSFVGCFNVIVVRRSGQTTKTTTESIENIYSNKCTYIEHTARAHAIVHHMKRNLPFNNNRRQNEKRLGKKPERERHMNKPV